MSFTTASLGIGAGVRRPRDLAVWNERISRSMYGGGADGAAVTSAVMPRMLTSTTNLVATIMYRCAFVPVVESPSWTYTPHRWGR